MCQDAGSFVKEKKTQPQEGFQRQKQIEICDIWS